MNFRYNDWLNVQLLSLQKQLELSDYNIVVEDEQMFLKRKKEEMKPDTIFVVMKYLASSLQFGAIVQPVQIMILSEKNGLDKVKILFNKFAEQYNWTVNNEGQEYIKHQYSTPVVLSNFNEVQYGYRSILYMSGSLCVMNDVLDIKTLGIDGKQYNPIAFNVSYAMTTDTQQMPDEYISSSRKTVSTFSITLTVPMISNDFVRKVLYILQEDLTKGTGDETFAFSITLRDDTVITKDMKMVSCQIVTAVNQVPSLQIAFMR